MHPDYSEQGTPRRPYTEAEIRTLDYHHGQIAYVVSVFCIFEVVAAVLGYLPSNGFGGVWLLIVFLVALVGGSEHLSRRHKAW